MARIIAQTALEIIAGKRRGGEHNFRGIGYQILYACYRLLAEFSDPHTNSKIRLEGLEDVDVNSTLNIGDEFIQLKHSVNPYDANKFWITGAMQNFFEVYRADPSSRFLVVHNMVLKKGALLALANADLTQETVAYWAAKMNSIAAFEPEVDIADFLSRISFRKWQHHELQDECIRLLLQIFQVNQGAEAHYLKALFFHVFEWSKNRALVTKGDLVSALASVTDAFSHLPVNPAIQNSWISPVLFDEQPHKNLEDYFDGRAATPAHISAKLPVRRLKWEKIISDEIGLADAVVIHASSGQGKSTLAWQVASNLASGDYSVYQLNSCQDWNEVNAVRDFIQTRLRIGQVPLIVIDGLSKQLGNWAQLVELLANLPVKVLVTTREEDWHRYNSDDSKVHVKLVSISLSLQEAKEIYNELKTRGKIAADSQGWQQAYEQVAERGLLIEYTYLLTKGEMIAARLSQQIKSLRCESDAGAKLEILRLISLADCMNVKLETDRLLTHVTNRVGMVGDRGMIIEQLENEYHFRLGKTMVEGLHPVRSRHLIAILHHYVAVASSLVSVFAVLDEHYVYDYAMAVSGFWDEEIKPLVLDKIAQILSTRKLSEIVYFLDGLMHTEPQRYWLQNREHFDNAYQRGVLPLFTATTIPFVELNTLETFAETIGADGNENFLALIELKKSLTPYSISQSDAALFATILGRHLRNVTVPFDRIEGLEFLMHWFEKLNLDFPITLDVNEQTLLSALDERAQAEVKELYTYFRLKAPDEYRVFVQDNKSLILGWLKAETESLTIEESGNDIKIAYLLDKDGDKANEYSVYRIEMVYHFLPVYEHYCTDAIILPFPYEEVFKAVCDNARKRMTSEALYPLFDVHLNQIWAHTIEANYNHLSSFHWQSEQLQMRRNATDFCKECIRLFEGLIEDNQAKYRDAVTKTIHARDAWQKLYRLSKSLGRPLKYFDKPKFSAEVKSLTRWYASLNNFLSQFTEIILPSGSSKTSNFPHLAVVNLKEAAHKLPEMQQAFAQVCAASYSYFDIMHPEEEQELFSRLLKTVMYYASIRLNQNKPPCRVAKVTINEWWQAQEQQKLLQVHSILDDFSGEYGHEVYKPRHFKKSALWNTVTIGIEGLDISGDEALWDLSVGLAGLAEADIAFAEIVFVKDGIATGALRFHQDYFKRFLDIVNDLEPDATGIPVPLPWEINDEVLEPLVGVSIPEKLVRNEVEGFLKATMALWRMTEARRRLDKANKYELRLLKAVEAREIECLNEHMPDRKKVSAFQEIENGDKLPESDEFVHILNNYLRGKLYNGKS